MKSAIRQLQILTLFVVAASGYAQSSEDYQAAIRAATEAYRGDCVEGTDIVVYAAYYDRDHGIEIPYINHFPQLPLHLPLQIMTLDFEHATLALHGTARQYLHMPLFDVPH